MKYNTLSLHIAKNTQNALIFSFFKIKIRKFFIFQSHYFTLQKYKLNNF